jgi:hypothetical protein
MADAAMKGRLAGRNRKSFGETACA